MVFKNCKIVGVLNVTPDSFSDGGKHFEPGAAAVFAKQLCEDGCDIIDIGGQSTRPGYTRISAQEELSRVEPVFQRFQKIKLAADLSIDTFYPEVAEKSYDYGVNIINYTFSFDDANILRLAKEREMYCIFNFCGSLNLYKDFCEGRVNLAKRYEIAEDKIIFDPGIGFGKTFFEDLEIIMKPEKFRVKGYSLFFGISRKRVVRVVRELLFNKYKNFSDKLSLLVNKHEKYLDILNFRRCDFEKSVKKIEEIVNFFRGKLSSEDLENCDDRDFLTGILSLLAVRKGVDYIRVHNVKLMKGMMCLAGLC